MTPTLIYCAKRNRFAPIALEYGFKYGAQLPNSVFCAPYFADQNYRNPQRAKYMAALEQYRPALATVLDLEDVDQLDDVLSWASEAARFVTEAVIIIPKCPNVVDHLPRVICGRNVRLGYAVPTSFGATNLDAHVFNNWEVHLLGGNPIEQFRLSIPHLDDCGRYVALDVRSIDCNYIQKSAVRWAQFLEATDKAKQASFFGTRPALRWRQLKEIGLGDIADAPYEAFRRSCAALAKTWASIKTG